MFGDMIFGLAPFGEYNILTLYDNTTWRIRCPAINDWGVQSSASSVWVDDAKDVQDWNVEDNPIIPVRPCRL